MSIRKNALASAASNRGASRCSRIGHRHNCVWLYFAREEPMATISIARKHSLSHKKARDVAEKIAKDLNKRFDLAYAWDGEHIDFERPGVTGRIHVGKDRIKLDVQLGLLLGMLKPTIEREIDLQLDKLLA
jgi:putative polyhydroxyalkanoate system protein